MSDEHSVPFWERKALPEMTKAEWEALCDGCGRCCLVILEDEERAEGDGDDGGSPGLGPCTVPGPGRYYETSVCCQLFDPTTRQCANYAARSLLVPGCVTLSAEKIETLTWMPESCAYRRLAEGRGLASWHPLRSGRRESVVEAGITVASDLRNEKTVPTDDLWEYITTPR